MGCGGCGHKYPSMGVSNPPPPLGSPSYVPGPNRYILNKVIPNQKQKPATIQPPPPQIPKQS